MSIYEYMCGKVKKKARVRGCLCVCVFIANYAIISSFKVVLNFFFLNMIKLSNLMHNKINIKFIFSGQKYRIKNRTGK